MAINEENNGTIRLAQFINDLETGRRYISGIREINSNNYFDDTIWITISSKVFSFLEENLEFYDGVKSKYYVAQTVGHVEEIEELQVDEVLGSDEVSLTAFANKYLFNMEEILISRTRMYPYQLWKYFQTYNILLSRGFVITDTNQEEKYLEIINTEDDNLIEALSTFLDNKDLLQLSSVVFNDYSNYAEKIRIAESKEEIKKLYSEFMSNYNR